MVQVWSTVEHRLMQHWDLDGCSGLTHLIYSRGCVWAAAANGSLYIFDAKAKLPLIELRVHTDNIRCLRTVGKEYMISCGASKDGSLAVMLNLPRGRHTQSSILPARASYTGGTDTFMSYDRYGFLQLSSYETEEPVLSDNELVASLPEDHQQDLARQDLKLLASSMAWEQYFLESAQSTGADGDATDYPSFQRTAENRRRIHEGVPDKFRQRVWTKLINTWVGKERATLHRDYYSQICDLNNKLYPQPPIQFLKQVNLDLHRTFPTNKYFHEDGHAINKLRRVLIAFMRHTPKVGYCQGFNFIAGFALLFLSEEMAFWCMCALINYIVPQGYFVDPMTDSRADQPVLRDLIRTHLPDMDAVLNEHHFDLSLISFNWFFTLFVEIVPTEVTLRIWDVLLYEGDMILFKAAFGLVEFAGKLIGGLDSNSNGDSPGEVRSPSFDQFAVRFDCLENRGFARV